MVGPLGFSQDTVGSKEAISHRRTDYRRVRDLTGYTVTPGNRIKTLKHAVTRYQITLDCYAATIASSRRKQGNRTPHRWVCAAELNDVPLSVTGRKIAHYLVAHPTLGM